MKITFYREDPAPYFADTDLVKNEPTPEHYVLEAFTRYHLAPETYWVLESHSIDDQTTTEKQSFTDLREQQAFYRARIKVINDLGFGYPVNREPI
jgi:hypothetical protein